MLMRMHAIVVWRTRGLTVLVVVAGNTEVCQVKS